MAGSPAHVPAGALLEVLEDSGASGFDKWEALEALGQAGLEGGAHIRGVSAVVALLDHEQRLVRHAALDLVISQGFRPPQASEDATRATRSLMRMIEAPRDKMDSQSRTLALAALSVCASRGDFLCIEAAVGAAQGEDAAVRKAAVRCLGGLQGAGPDARIARKLLPLMHDHDAAVREQCARALCTVSTWRDESSVVSLAMLAQKDPVLTVRRAAEDCLVELFSESAQAEADAGRHMKNLRNTLAEIGCTLSPSLTAVLGLS